MRTLLTLVLALALAGPAAAANWLVTQNDDCTGLRAATVGGQATAAAACCQTANAGECNKRMNFGDLFEVIVTLVADGSYTTGGDQLAAVEAEKIGLDAIVHTQCELVRNTTETVIKFPLVLKSAVLNRPTIKLFTATATEQSAAAIDGDVLQCMFYGY